MITIDKAILHVLDFNSGVTVYSEQEMDLQENIQMFLQKHIEKSLARQDAKSGDFYEDSVCKAKISAYLKGESTFVAFSQELAKHLENSLLHTEEVASADIIFLDVHVDEQRKLILFKCNNHVGYVHQVCQTEHGVQNEIINHYAIMPNLSQRMDEFVIIDAASLQLSLVAKKYTMEGESVYLLPEVVLECSMEPSQKDALKSLEKTTVAVAESFGQDAVAAAAAAKNYVAEHMEISNELDLKRAGEEVFKEQPAMQADYNRRLEEQGFDKPVQMDQEATLKKVAKHKLKTDTGIELAIPTDYFDNTQFVEFHNETDGTLSITLKHIASIINRG